jgi:single-stranded-DNA-specific exonuclease
MAEPARALLPHAPLMEPPGCTPPSPPPPPTPAVPPLRVAQEPATTTDAPRAPTPPRLELAPYDLTAALTLERELGIGHVLSQILVRRGFADPGSAREFLDPQEEHPPSAFGGMAEAAQTITAHVAAGTRITVHGDYDVDGVCATAIMVRGLRSLGASVDWFLPGRLEDGYGLSAETVRRLAQRGTKLLITVDCGITAVDEVALASASGMDVVVCDHHQSRADGSLPQCQIIHPALCGYPGTSPCGTAVAAKVIEALEASNEQDLELVALATVADLMPLRGENRRLVRAGLRAIANTANPGLRALMAVSSTDPSGLNANALGFRLAPRINAAGRLARADAALELLLTESPSRAEEIAAELDRLNAERRVVEQRITWEAEALATEAGERSMYVLAADDWHPGVIGIVASRIAERFHRPAVLVALDGEMGTGSARSIPGFDLFGALQSGAEHMERYGGHRAAAGMTVRRDRLEQLTEALEAHAEAVLTPELLIGVETADAVVCGSQLGLDLVEELELLEPTGLGNPGPRLLIRGARLDDVQGMGDPPRHARFAVVAGGARTPAVAFGCRDTVRERAGEPADATFRLERNTWKGVVSPRLVLRQVWPCAPGAIEVVGEGEMMGEGENYLRAVLREVERELDPLHPERPEGSRTVLDRRGQGPLAVVADALASGRVLAVCADVPRRLEGLRTRLGGFSLASYHALEQSPELAAKFEHLVALDPPSCSMHDQLLRAGSGFTHLTWGEAELRFAQQMHERDYSLRTSLVALYRSLRLRQRAAGEDLERLLRGDGSPGRPARLAGRLIRVLTELELVLLDRDLPALAMADGAPTALERSSAYRVYANRHEDGRRFLSSANQRPSG